MRPLGLLVIDRSHLSYHLLLRLDVLTYVSQDSTLTHSTTQPTQINYSYLCCGSWSNSDCSLLDNVVYSQDHEGLDLLICNSSVLVANIFADNTNNELSSKTQHTKWMIDS